jgi:hypothetical protein
MKNFQRPKTWCQNTTFRHAITTKLPAIYHVVAPQIPAPPLKNTSKVRLYRKFHHARKKQVF